MNIDFFSGGIEKTSIPDLKKGAAASSASLNDDGPSHCMSSKIRYFQGKKYYT